MAATKKSQEIAAAKASVRADLTAQFERINLALVRVPQFVNAGSHTTSIAWRALAEYAMNRPPSGPTSSTLADLRAEIIRRETIIAQLVGDIALPHD